MSTTADVTGSVTPPSLEKVRHGGQNADGTFTHKQLLHILPGLIMGRFRAALAPTLLPPGARAWRRPTRTGLRTPIAIRPTFIAQKENLTLPSFRTRPGRMARRHINIKPMPSIP